MVFGVEVDHPLLARCSSHQADKPKRLPEHRGGLQFGKPWDIRDPKPLPTEVPAKEFLRYYCQRNFQAVGVTFEFPWFGRTPEDVRDTGREALWALLRALDPPPEKLR